MSQHPHEPDELEPDPSVPPRPEEEVADAGRQDPAADPVGGDSDPVAGGQSDDPPAQGEGRPDSH
jgi:hypothetical protein